MQATAHHSQEPAGEPAASSVMDMATHPSQADSPGHQVAIEGTPENVDTADTQTYDEPDIPPATQHPLHVHIRPA